MTVDFERMYWQDYPSHATPINAENLNHLEEGVAGLYSDVSKIEEELGEGVGEYVTSWLNEHVDPVGSAVVVDNTLAIEGAAADAKKTGDEISSVKEDLEETKNELKSDFTQFQESGDVHFDPAGFQVGGIDSNTGDIVPSHTKRVAMTDISTAAYDMTLTADSAHKMMIAYYANNVYEDVSSWKNNGSIAINKGQQYRVVIADFPTETTSTSVEEKVRGLSCTSIFSNLLSCVASENEAWR